MLEVPGLLRGVDLKATWAHCRAWCIMFYKRAHPLRRKKWSSKLSHLHTRVSENLTYLDAIRTPWTKHRLFLTETARLCPRNSLVDQISTRLLYDGNYVGSVSRELTPGPLRLTKAHGSLVLSSPSAELQNFSMGWCSLNIVDGKRGEKVIYS